MSERQEILDEFDGNVWPMADEIVRLRKNQMPEGVPEVIPVFITFKPEGGCYSVSLLEPKDELEYTVAYQPVD